MSNQTWASGHWSTAPASVEHSGTDLLVTAVKGSDAWRETAHEYITDNAHSLLAPMATDTAVEVTFIADFTEQLDQAGIMLRSSPTHWIKSGVEYADGILQLGAVVTRETSDWSSNAVPWSGKEVTINASRTGNAVVIRAKIDDEPFRMIRLAWVDPNLEYEAGPYLCAPTRDGFTVRFTGWRVVEADTLIHPDGLPDVAKPS